MTLISYQVNHNFYTFVCWDNETDTVDWSDFCEELDSEYIDKINNGTLTDEDKDVIIEEIRCNLECGTQLCGKILDDCGQEINTEQDIYRVMGVSEEDVLRENWENQWENEGIPFDVSRSTKPEYFWLGRTGKYLFVGYGWSC
jgi:hypothetical protein